MALYENDQRAESVMLSNMRWGHCYHTEVDYFPRTACPSVAFIPHQRQLQNVLFIHLQLYLTLWSVRDGKLVRYHFSYKHLFAGLETESSSFTSEFKKKGKKINK